MAAGFWQRLSVEAYVCLHKSTDGGRIVGDGGFSVLPESVGTGRQKVTGRG